MKEIFEYDVVEGIPKSILANLNDYGRKGWEAVCLLASPDKGHLVILMKRKLIK
jgi:hypothetical protein